MEPSSFSSYKERILQYRYEFYLLAKKREGTPNSLDALGLEYRYRAQKDQFDSSIHEFIGQSSKELYRQFEFKIDALIPEYEIIKALNDFKKEVLEACLLVKRNEMSRRSEATQENSFDNVHVHNDQPDVWDYCKKKDIDPDFAENTFRDWDRLLKAYELHLAGKPNSVNRHRFSRHSLAVENIASQMRPVTSHHCTHGAV